MDTDEKDDIDRLTDILFDAGLNGVKQPSFNGDWEKFRREIAIELLKYLPVYPFVKE